MAPKNSANPFKKSKGSTKTARVESPAPEHHQEAPGPNIVEHDEDGENEDDAMDDDDEDQDFDPNNPDAYMAETEQEAVVENKHVTKSTKKAKAGAVGAPSKKQTKRKAKGGVAKKRKKTPSFLTMMKSLENWYSPPESDGEEDTEEAVESNVSTKTVKATHGTEDEDDL